MNPMEWLKRLVAIDTTSRNSNLHLIQIIQDWLQQHGLTMRLTHDASAGKANLFATIPARDGSIYGGIVLSGHTDVVPVDGQDWATNPFDAIQINDKIYGRGTCDMKGFLAVALSLVPSFKNLQLAHPIHFAFSYDEEVGCLGAEVMIADIVKAGIKPKVCIVGEPTDMQAVIAHKGIQVFRCHVKGQAAHSSLTSQGCNAIEYAAKLICYLRELSDQIKQNGPFDADFDVPYSSMTTNRIEGGIAHNIIPESCEFFFEWRPLPQVNSSDLIDKINHYIVNDLLPMMQKEKNIANIEIENIANVPSFETTENAAIRQFKTLLKTTKKHKVAYATEAGLFQQALIPTLVCGPGNIEQAHKANEFVTLAQLKKCEVFLRKVVLINVND